MKCSVSLDWVIRNPKRNVRLLEGQSPDLPVSVLLGGLHSLSVPSMSGMHEVESLGFRDPSASLRLPGRRIQIKSSSVAVQAVVCTLEPVY